MIRNIKIFQRTILEMYIYRNHIFIYIFLIYITVVIAGCSSGLLSSEITPPKVTTQLSIDKPVLLSVNYVRTVKNLGLLRPTGITFDTAGNFYVADTGHHRIIVYSRDWNKIEEIGKFGWRLGEFNNPTDLAFHVGQNSVLFVADSGNNRVLTFFLSNQLFRKVAQVDLESPLGIATDGQGNVYVADTNNNRFLKIGGNGSILMERGGYGWSRTQFNTPTDLVVDKQTNIYVVDSGNKRVKKYDFSGNVSAVWSHSKFAVPYAVCLDKFGNVFVTDLANQTVYVFNQNGKQLIDFTKTELQEPTDIAIRDEMVYVTDASTGDIKVFRIVYSIVSQRF